MVCGLSHVYIVVEEIIGHSICKLPNGNRIFLIIGEANLTSTIVLGLEALIVVTHPIETDKNRFLNIR